MMSDTQELTYSAVLEAIWLGIRDLKGSAMLEPLTESTGLWAGVDPDQPSLDFDSLDLLELVIFLEEEFGWEIAEEQIDAEGWRTVGDLASAALTAAQASV